MAAVAAPCGLATWVVHGGIPPGAGFGSPSTAIDATLRAPRFAILVAVFAALLGLTWWLVASRLRRPSDVSGAAVLAANVPLLWGAALPLLAPLLDAVSFWCSAPPLAALGIGSGALLSVRRWARLEVCGGLVPIQARRAAGSRDTARVATAALAAAIPLLLLCGGWSAPSGDEPNYLVVAHSLVEDHDLDLADDFRDRVYAPFHPAVLSPHYRPGLREGSRYSMHGVGLPLLIAPAYALGASLSPGASVALPRAVLALLYGVFAWILYGFVTDVASDRAAMLGTLATTLLAPLVFAPLYLFPEVPAMTLSLFAFRGLCREEHGEARYGWALAALPFFGVKYIPLSVALLAVGIGAAPTRRGARLRNVGGPLAAGLALHALFTWRLYGSVSPAAVYLGAGEQAGAPALGGDWGAYLAAWPAAMATAIGFLVDQKEGLLAYGPHLLLAIVGLAWMWQRRRKLLCALALVAAAYVGPYALSQQLGGQGPPARPLMAIAWVLAPALGIALSLVAESRAFAALRGALVALGLCLTVAYATQPELLPHDYPVLASRLLQNYSPYGSGWWKLFPQWVNIEEPNRAVTAAWTVLLILAGVLLWRHGRRCVGLDRNAGAVARQQGSADAASRSDVVGWRAAMAVLVIACSAVLLHHLLVVRTDRHRPTPLNGGLVAWVAEELPPVAFAEPEGVWATPGAPVDFVLTAEADLRALDVALRVLVPARVAVSIQGATFAGYAVPGDSLVRRLRPGRGRADAGGRAYHVRLYAGSGASPADLSGGADERYLGVFMESYARLQR